MDGSYPLVLSAPGVWGKDGDGEEGLNMWSEKKKTSPRRPVGSTC